MPREREDRVDPRQPTLVVTVGNTSRKCRPLERDVVLLGRSAGCDVPLAAPEIAPIHCVVARGPAGWRVRDCSGRGATLVNGEVVVDAPLADGDALQVGSFLLTAHLPPPAAAPAAPPAPPPQAAGVTSYAQFDLSSEPPVARLYSGTSAAEIERLRRSRRKLARLALGLRRRIREATGRDARAADPHEGQRAELDRRAEELRCRQAEVATRERRLEHAEAVYNERRLALEAAEAALRNRLAEADREVARRQAETRAVSTHDSDPESRRADEQNRATVPDEAAHAFEIRKRELDAFAGKLREQRRKLTEGEERLARQVEELQAAARRADERESEAAAAHSRRRAEIAQSEAALRGQRAEVIRLMGELRAARQGLPANDAADGLRQEVEELRGQLAASAEELDRVTRHAQVDVSRREEQLDLLHGQLEELRSDARAREAELAELRQELEAVRPPEGSPEAAVLDLREKVQDREEQIAQLRARLDEALEAKDPAFVEFELNRLHGELGRDREELEEQVRHLRQRQEEIEDAARETELQMSRERAQIARDRAELTRLRDEIRREQQRLQRNDGALAKLEPVHKLKEELGRSSQGTSHGSNQGTSHGTGHGSNQGTGRGPAPDAGSHPNTSRWDRFRGLGDSAHGS